MPMDAVSLQAVVAEKAPIVEDVEAVQADADAAVAAIEAAVAALVERADYTELNAAVEAAEALAAEGISARVINIHTIKPMDSDLLTKAAKECGAIVTAEEHTVIGGLGSAVCEVLSETCPTPVVRVGVEDRYGKSGTVPALLEEYGLTPAAIVSAAKRAIALKK